MDTLKNIKCFPLPVVKLIIKDLISGDSAKEMLKLTNEQLIKTEEKVTLKDSIINTMKVKETNYVNIIDIQNKKYDILDGYTKKLEFQLKKEKVKGKFKSIFSVGIIGVLSFFLITK
jgi:hypothetical protein